MAADGQEPHVPVSDGHPDLDTLADADAAALDPPAAAEVLGHAADCPACGGVLDALRAVRSDLASLPRPPIPAGVAARLDAVLDVERRARSVPPAAAGTVPEGQGSRSGEGGRALPAAGDVVPLDRVRGRRRGRVLGWAAAAAVVVAGGATGGAVALTGHGGAGGGGTSVAAEDLSAPSPTASPTGGPGVQLAPGQGVFPQETAGSVPRYTRQDIEDNIAAILAAAGCDGGSCHGTGGEVLPDAERRSRCTSELNGQGVRGTPKAVQFALFEGTPAFVFVFDDNRVVVVGSDCGDSASPTILFSDR
jgi:hypothetical protein